MNFRQSAVKSISRDTVIERDPRLPRDIQPVLLGSGEIALALDATGLQGLNPVMGRYREAASFEHGTYMWERNCHLYRDEALSEHYTIPTPRIVGAFNFSNLPCGWLDYDLAIDGRTYDTGELAENACDWSREFTPRSGIAVTSFALGPLRVTWRVGVPLGGVEAVVGFDFESLDRKPHALELRARCRHTLRDGTPLYCGGTADAIGDGWVLRSWDATDATSTAKLIAPIRLNWALAADRPARPLAEAHALGLLWRARGRRGRLGLLLVSGSDRDGTDSPGFVRRRIAAFKRTGAAGALESVAQSWRRWFEGAADLRLGDPEKEFITAQAQYALRAGAGWHSGIPLGTLWTQKFCASTFWDSYFACEGMLRAGHVDEVRAFVGWLVRTMNPAGRPHFWMSYYTGKPSNDPAEDKAYQSSLAFAGAAIRLYEVTRDRADLRLRTFPYVYAVAKFLAEEIFVLNDGGWNLKGSTAGDIGVAEIDAAQETTILAWAALTVAKCAEYAAVLGKRDAAIARCGRIAAHFRAHPIALREKSTWFPWFPYLAPAEPLVDFDSWRKPMLTGVVAGNPANHENAETGLGQQYAGMPWANCTMACSYIIAGLPDPALEYFHGATAFVSGMGYLTEGPYEWQVGGNSPYVPSNGAWLSAACAFFAHGSIWNDELVLCELPALWRYQRLEWENVVTPNGARVSGRYEPCSLEARIETDRPRQVRVRIPSRIAGEPLRVTVDGRRVKAEEQGEWLRLPIARGTRVLRLERDLAKACPALVIDPMDQGGRLAELTAAAGVRVRWLRDVDVLPRVIGPSTLIVAHISYTAFPGETVNLLREAVERGAALLTMYHGGVLAMDDRMAALVGANARYEKDWIFDSAPRRWQLTERGRATLPALEASLEIPVTQTFVCTPEPDVEVLATDAESGQPVVSRRPLGKGNVWWIAAGGKNADQPYAASCNDFRFIRRIFVFGESRGQWHDPKWLKSPDWMALFGSVVRAARGGRT